VEWAVADQPVALSHAVSKQPQLRPGADQRPALVTAYRTSTSRCEYVTDVDSQRSGKFVDIVQGDVSFSSFDRTDVSPVQAGKFGERFLRKTSRRPVCPEITRKACTTWFNPTTRHQSRLIA